MPGKGRDLGWSHKARGRARYRALTAVALAVAVLAGSAPSDAATIGHQVTSPGPRYGHGTELAAGPAPGWVVAGSRRTAVTG